MALTKSLSRLDHPTLQTHGEGGERETLLALSQRKLNALGVPVAYVDRNQRYRFANKSFTDWLGKRNDEVVGREVIEVVGRDVYQLYHAYIAEYAKARLDSRAWRALLAKYRIDLAVDEYRAPLDVINPMTGAHQRAPASLAYWPRKEWALIGYDDVAMTFARRAAFAPEVMGKIEVRGVVPDAAR